MHKLDERNFADSKSLDYTSIRLVKCRIKNKQLKQEASACLKLTD